MLLLRVLILNVVICFLFEEREKEEKLYYLCWRRGRSGSEAPRAAGGGESGGDKACSGLSSTRICSLLGLMMIA